MLLIDSHTFLLITNDVNCILFVVISKTVVT